EKGPPVDAALIPRGNRLPAGALVRLRGPGPAGRADRVGLPARRGPAAGAAGRGLHRLVRAAAPEPGRVLRPLPVPGPRAGARRGRRPGRLPGRHLRPTGPGERTPMTLCYRAPGPRTAEQDREEAPDSAATHFHQEASAMFEDADLIHRYSRAQATADGVLIDVTQTAKVAAFKYPVALTAATWAQCVAVPPGISCQDEAGHLWDVLTMLRW